MKVSGRACGGSLKTKIKKRECSLPPHPLYHCVFVASSDLYKNCEFFLKTKINIAKY